MKTIVIAGARSNIGKTTLAEGICRLLPGSVCVKLGHGKLKEDVDNGGIENSNGKCHFNATHMTMEIRTPLNTGDSLGYDINTAVNQSLNIFLWFHDAESGIDYSQIREADYDYDVIKLTLSCSAPLPIPIQTLIIGLFGVTVFTLIIKKRKQRK